MKREFDRKIWKSGNSYVVTIPSETVERYALEGKFITVAISDSESIIIKEKKEKSEK
jgi:antitoxin component of MazEF toxin-antitoxin module